MESSPAARYPRGLVEVVFEAISVKLDTQEFRWLTWDWRDTVLSRARLTTQDLWYYRKSLT
jgi:hypothetical protein